MNINTLLEKEIFEIELSLALIDIFLYHTETSY